MSDDRRADARLADRIRSGDTEALGELYDWYADMAGATAVRVVGGRDEAEDLVHHAFLAVWRKIDRLNATRGSLREWLMTVFRNRAIDRARAPRAGIDVDGAEGRSLLRTGPNPIRDEVLARTSADRLRVAKSALLDEQRIALALAYFDGYTHREVAELTGVTTGTANGRLRLALGYLGDASAETAAPPPARKAPLPARTSALSEHVGR